MSEKEGSSSGFPVFPIRSKSDVRRAFQRVDEIWGSDPGTLEGDELDLWVPLIEDYEDQYSVFPTAEPSTLINYRMKELRLSKENLASRTGWSVETVEGILSGVGDITLKMLPILCEVLETYPRVFVSRQKRPRHGLVES